MNPTQEDEWQSAGPLNERDSISFIVTRVSVSVFVGYLWVTNKLDLFILYLLISLKVFSQKLGCIKSSMSTLTESYTVL